MLKIKCPSCSSQFSVGDEFLGKYVECGSCEYQFTVAEMHIEDGNKKDHYPVHKNNDLSTFSKTFEKVGADNTTETVHDKHLSKLRQNDFMPDPLWKKAVIILGLALLGSGIVLLVLGSLKNGFLTDVSYNKRFIIAGFIALVTSICFLLGSKFFKNALPLCLLSIITLGALAYLLPKYELPTRVGEITPSSVLLENNKAPTATSNENEYTSITKLKKECRYEPVAAAIRKAKENGDTSADSVIAVWIQGAEEEQQYAIQDFYKSTLSLENRPNYYIRKKGALVVLEGINRHTIQEIAQLSEIFGSLDDIYVTQRILSIRYKKGNFASLSTERITALSNEEDPDFYRLNFQESRHFDINRVLPALKRLKVAPPRYTSDAYTVFYEVIRRFNDPRIIDEVSSCLLKWNGDDLSPHLVVLDQVADYSNRALEDEELPKDFVLVLLRAGSTQIPAVALDLWRDNPDEWESTLINSQRDFTSLVASNVTPDDRSKNLSIIRIIGKTKSPNSKALLNSLKSKLDSSYSAAIGSAMLF